ncbi:hypothetical protein [Actibacterium sp. 188UL27-1]|uniref:hypothetical protein n=1 Tax=Actibacterium sp. 188UL27-1 TaxID=2786961 RepID=UPI00195BA86A|nr:hypothetical protein [Actibacterium sp. 188UL27-1]MBM7066137.1 hypothetical protein [Actibacterium sp. 188UL27-1]
MQNRHPDENGWQSSATTWIDRMDGPGHKARRTSGDRQPHQLCHGQRDGGAQDLQGHQYRETPLGRYLSARKQWFEWDGLRVRNWHRPLSRYMQWFLQAGMILEYFDEPRPKGGDADLSNAYENRPFLMVMAWRKPDTPH